MSHNAHTHIWSVPTSHMRSVSNQRALSFTFTSTSVYYSLIVSTLLQAHFTAYVGLCAQRELLVTCGCYSRCHKDQRSCDQRLSDQLRKREQPALCLHDNARQMPHLQFRLLKNNKRLSPPSLSLFFPLHSPLPAVRRACVWRLPKSRDSACVSVRLSSTRGLDTFHLHDAHYKERESERWRDRGWGRHGDIRPSRECRVNGMR